MSLWYQPTRTIFVLAEAVEVEVAAEAVFAVAVLEEVAVEVAEAPEDAVSLEEVELAAEAFPCASAVEVNAAGATAAASTNTNAIKAKKVATLTQCS